MEILEPRTLLSGSPLSTAALVDVTSQCALTFDRLAFDRRTAAFTTSAEIQNLSDRYFSQDLFLVLNGMAAGGPVTAVNAEGVTDTGHPYYRVDAAGSLPGLGLAPGTVSLPEALKFLNPSGVRFTPSGILLAAPWQRTIEHMAATPGTIIVNQPTTVTATVQVGADPNLIVSSVTALQLNAAGTSTTVVGTMYDDGTHGDQHQGDGTFTAQVSVNMATAGNIRLIARANYTSSPTIAYSDIATVNVVSLPSQAEVQAVLDDNHAINQAFDTLVQSVGRELARIQMLANLRSDPLVAGIVLSDDGTSISIRYTCGLKSLLLTGSPGTNGGTTEDDTPSSNDGTAFAYSWFFTNGAAVSGILNNNTLVQSTTLSGSSFTLDAVAGLKSGVIYMDTHGGMDGSDVVICTGQQLPDQNIPTPEPLLTDWQLGRIIVAGDKWAFEPSFVTAHCSSLPDSLVVTSACDGLYNNTMAQAFIAKGAKTYVGWSESVGHGFAQGIEQTLFTRLAAGDSVKQAFDKWTIAERTDPGLFGFFTDHAFFNYFGDANLKLPTDLIKNGGFETGDLSHWTTGFTDFGSAIPGGYATAISERAAAGSYSARLGKFDQPYTGGQQGSPQYGAEPYGIDWMYQDVTLPSTGHFQLSFSYDVRTYDGVAWDWLDAQIINPSSGAVLGTVVSHFGYPGTWGIYWESGWQTASYDLAAFNGQTIRVKFGVRQDGYGDEIATYLDKISIKRAAVSAAMASYASALPSAAYSIVAATTEAEASKPKYASALHSAACDMVIATAGTSKSKYAGALDPSVLNLLAYNAVQSKPKPSARPKAEFSGRLLPDFSARLLPDFDFAAVCM
jgi:hypothetical protein